MLRAPRASLAAALGDGGEQWDDTNTRWMGALVLVLGALLTSILLALVPPTAEGAWGWIVAAVVIAGRLGAAMGLLSGRGPVRRGPLYLMSALGIAGMCALQFLASQQAYFHDLILIDLLFVAAVHTPRWAFAAVGLAVAGLVPALLHHSTAPVSVAEWAAEAILWAFVTGLVLLYTGRTRGQQAQLDRIRRRAEALARVDALTGLGNRRAFDEALDREMSLARRYGTDLSVLVGDLDAFKQVNDRHGHQAGDELLREVATRIAETVRRPDACFRWGGDEFAVLLPRTARTSAELVAARVRAAVAQHVRDPGGAPASISLGVAELHPDQRPGDLLATADRELMAAKAAPAPRHSWRFGRGEVRRLPRR